MVDCARDRYILGANEWDGESSTIDHHYLIKEMEICSDLAPHRKDIKPKKFKNMAMAGNMLMNAGIDEKRYEYSKKRVFTDDDLDEMKEEIEKRIAEGMKIDHPGDSRVGFGTLKNFSKFMGIDLKLLRRVQRRSNIELLLQSHLQFNDPVSGLLL